MRSRLAIRLLVAVLCCDHTGDRPDVSCSDRSLFSFAVPVTTADPAVTADPITTHGYLMAELRRRKIVQPTPSAAVLFLAAVATMAVLLPLCARAEGEAYVIVVVHRNKS